MSMVLLYVVIKDGFILFLLPWCDSGFSILPDEGLKHEIINHRTINNFPLTYFIMSKLFSLLYLSNYTNQKVENCLTARWLKWVLPPCPLETQYHRPLSVPDRDWSLSISPVKIRHKWLLPCFLIVLFTKITISCIKVAAHVPSP